MQDVEVNVGRPSRQTKAKGTRASQPEEVETQPSEAERRKRGRKPTRHVETEAPEEPQPDTEPQPQTKRKRGRPSLNQEPQDEPVEQERPKRRGRRSLQEPPPDDAQNQSRKESKQKRGRRGSAVQEATPKAQDDGPKKRKRVSAGRPSLSSKDKSDQINKDGEQDTSKTSRRRSTNNDEPPPSPEKPYLHLVSKTRRVRPSTIAAKWSPLTGPSLHAVSSILEMAHVPIIQRTSHTQNRHTHATTALRLITHRINKKLSKGLPFPAASAAVTSSRTAKDGDGGRETELDFEAVLDARALLERQLVPGLQAVELLRTERNKMESDLERDYERLRDLEARARGQVREKRELLKKAHVLAPTSRVTPADDGDSRPQLDDSLGNIFKVRPLSPLQLTGLTDLELRRNPQPPISPTRRPHGLHPHQPLSSQRHRTPNRTHPRGPSRCIIPVPRKGGLRERRPWTQRRSVNRLLPARESGGDYEAMIFVLRLDGRGFCMIEMNQWNE